jgi:signal transduction histidine kinase
MLLWPVIHPTAFLLSFGVVSLAAFVGGFWPGMLAALESAALTDYFLIEPRFTWTLDSDAYARTALFLICCILVAALGERHLRIQKRLKKLNAKLAGDVIKHKLAEEALRRSEKLATAGQLAATIAHEINNPLESILNLVHLAESSDGLPACAKEYLDLTLEEVKRISDLSRDILGYYRSSSAPTDFRVTNVLGVILGIYKKNALKRHVQMVTQWDESLRCVGVPGTLKQIVANLTSNALDAVPEGGRIVIRAREAAHDGHSGLLVTVADDGPGIPRTYQKRVFQAFFTTKEETGTGLGLWVTRELVTRADGTIKLRTAANGSHRGTTFQVFLPNAATTAAPAAIPAVSIMSKTA